MPRKKKQKVPEGMKAFSDISDEDIEDDIVKFIDSGVISATETIPYTLAILYNSLNKDDQKRLVSGICKISKSLNDVFTEVSSKKKGTSVEYMFALIYMLSNMNSTLMQDGAWIRLTGKGLLCREKFLEMTTKKSVSSAKTDDNKGYG